MFANQLTPYSTQATPEDYWVSPFMGDTSLTNYWDPYKAGGLISSFPMRDLTRDANRMMRQGTRAMQPIANADLIETDTGFRCAIDVPGVKDVQVSVDNGVLNVTGEKERFFEKDEGFVHKSERYWGRVERNIALPDSANGDAAKATFKNGVLCIDIPKFEGKAKTRRILPVTSA
jgi:HSP20 family molecular chaperone IbpA